MKKKGFLVFTSLYAILMTATIVFCISLLTYVLRQKNTAPPIIDGGSEYIYVYVTDTTTVTEQPSTESEESLEEGWIIKEHDQKIGIFHLDGSLLCVLDTYTKTLPKADRDLLREGISVFTKQELYALIEDYTG